MEESLLSFFFAIMSIFVWKPHYVFIAGFLFLIPCFLSTYTKWSKRICLVTAIVWFLYGAWETHITFWRSSTGDMAIRIDMVFIGPVILAVTLFGIFAILKGRKSTT